MTQYHIPKEENLRQHHCESLKSCIDNVSSEDGLILLFLEHIMVKCSNVAEWRNCLGFHGEWINWTKMPKFCGGRCSVSYGGAFEVVESITATEGGDLIVLHQ